MKKHFLFTVLLGPLTLAASILMVASFFAIEPWRSLLALLADESSTTTLLHLEAHTIRSPGALPAQRARA